jgi:antitoxin PrlF
MSTDTPHRATVRKKAQLTLPAEVRAALHVAEGDEVEFVVTETGEVLLRGLAVIPADQRWFWTEEWQAGERESSDQIAAGNVATHDDVDAFFDALDS